MSRLSLSDLTYELDPRRTIDQLNNCAEKSIRSEPYHSPPKNHEDYRSILGGFGNRCHTNFFGGRYEPNIEFYSDMCREPLYSIYGSQWFTITFEMAKTGKNGGLTQVFKDIAFGLASTYSKRKISGIVDRALELLPTETIEKLSLDYRQKWGHIVPRHPLFDRWLNDGQPLAQIFFERVLQNHPYWVKGLQGVF